MLQGIIDYLRSLLYSEAYHPGKIAVEMFLIGLVVYVVLRFLHGTRGAHLLQGLVILLMAGFLVVRVLAEQFGLQRLQDLYVPFVWTVLLTTLVVFQPELRQGLMRLGVTGWRRSRESNIELISRAVATACRHLSKNKIGALIAIEREVGLSGLTDQGVRLDAHLTPELLNTIFWPGSALHDLGTIIQHGRITAAACPFPMAEAQGLLDASLGSRHRAALGISLDSDALVVVVSEETGAISIAEYGRLIRHIPADMLAGTLKWHLSNSRGGPADAGPAEPALTAQEGLTVLADPPPPTVKAEVSKPAPRVNV